LSIPAKAKHPFDWNYTPVSLVRYNGNASLASLKRLLVLLCGKFLNLWDGIIQRQSLEGTTSTYDPQFSHNGQTSPAEEIALMNTPILLPHTAHLTIIETNLLSRFKKAASTPIVHQPYFVVFTGMSEVPGLFAEDLEMVRPLSF